MKLNTGHCQINIERSGNSSGPVVMMAHSLGCSLHMWDPQMSALEPDFDIVRLDMRGHGLSDAPAGPYALEDLADDVIAVMDQLQIKQAHWVGLSIGGMIGQSLLLRYPGRFLSAVLCDTMSELPDGAMKIWQERIKKVEIDGLSSIKKATLTRWFTPAFLEAGSIGLNEVAKQLDVASDNGYVACCQAIAGLNYTDQLSSIDTNTLLIVGAEDIATPVSSSKIMHELMPNSRLVIIDNASHISNVEQVEAFNAALVPFIHTAAGIN